MRDELGLALLLITHDLGVVAETADRVAVMYAGRIVEEAPVRELFLEPKHPYTRALLSSIPGRTPGRRVPAIPGSVPTLGTLLPGCPFTPRCPDRFEPCARALPALTSPGLDRLVRCYLHAPAAERPTDGSPTILPAAAPAD
jgi:oligopeptide/dipeptide ABC transporter ATP-binding protein